MVCIVSFMDNLGDMVSCCCVVVDFVTVGVVPSMLMGPSAGVVTSMVGVVPSIMIVGVVFSMTVPSVVGVLTSMVGVELSKVFILSVVIMGVVFSVTIAAGSAQLGHAHTHKHTHIEKTVIQLQVESVRRTDNNNYVISV